MNSLNAVAANYITSLDASLHNAMITDILQCKEDGLSEDMCHGWFNQFNVDITPSLAFISAIYNGQYTS